MIKVFIGYDGRETEAFEVLSHSIHARASCPVAITPLVSRQLGDLLWRPRDPLQSTDFSFSRFLVPHLCDFRGHAVFMDSDMLCRDDIAQLMRLADPAKAVQVVKHDHAPDARTKSLGRAQTRYPRKNWSSLMLFDCAQCTALDTDYVNTATGLELHRFTWIDDEKIGEVPGRWNHLVDYDPPVAIEEISLLHYTSGGPWHPACRDCGYADAWFAERARMRGQSRGQ